MALDGRPACPEHPGSKVLLDGYYGAKEHQKQRYKCVLPDGSRHVFTEKLPRRRYKHPTECLECEQHVSQLHGPAYPRQFHFAARQIAAALVDVGNGVSFRRAGQVVRREAKRSTSGIAWWNTDVAPWANMVGDWVEVFAPLLFEPHAPKEWPDILVVDDAPFKLKDPMGKPGGTPAFTILAAVGYTSGEPHLLRLEAFPSTSAASWVQFFKTLDGTPKRIVCDQARGITRAIPIAWPAPETPFIYYCLYHLRESFGKTFYKHTKKPGWPIWEAFEKAFRSPADFSALAAIVKQKGSTSQKRWMTRMEGKVMQQLGMKVYPTATGAVETRLNQVKEMVGTRYGSFRNRERLNRTLMLMQLEMTGKRNEAEYARIIRDYLEEHEGFAPVRHQILDPKGISSLRL